MGLKANDRRLIILGVGTEIVPSGNRIELQAELIPAFLVYELWISNWICDRVPERGAVRESVESGYGSRCQRRKRNELELVSRVIIHEHTR
jgi:hypothetical protein